jgi:transcriptional regulator with XRE-family HTH domain
VVAGHRTLDPATRLRTAREEKGWSQRQLAEATKLSVRAIELLESDRLGELPEGIYRRSIVRSVAREIGLNADQLLTEFAQRHPEALPATSAAAIIEQKPTSSFQQALALASAVLPLAAGVLYFVLPWQEPHRAAVIPPSSIELEQRQIEPVRRLTAGAEIVPVGGFADAPRPASRPVPVVVTLTISSRCQLRVVADGTEILGRVMEPGETVPIELGGEILLLGDNAGAVQFSINGQAGRQLGEPGDVLSARIGRDDYQDFLVRYN